ncbi:hypothetical protein ACSDQ9_04755 [Aestuariimicrobium soli]|uniref:hypothetical protein n=1 Tax=Aestuariimicrobium soli TaxID=2035834 RepID=UPI003EBD32BE
MSEHPLRSIVGIVLPTIVGMAALAYGLLVSTALYGVGCASDGPGGCHRELMLGSVAFMVGLFVVAAVCLAIGGRNLARRRARRL